MSLETGNGFAGGDVTVGFTLIDGSGTTANGSAVDLGGTLTQNTTITRDTNDFVITDVATNLSFKNGSVTLPILGAQTGVALQYSDATDAFTSIVTSQIAGMFWEDAAGGVVYSSITADSSGATLYKQIDASGSAQFRAKDDMCEIEFTDGVDANVFSLTLFDLAISTYPDTRDDTGTTTPINFIYTDGTGKFLSSPTTAITGWSLTGTAGTNPFTNYVGTSDAQPTVFTSNGNANGTNITIDDDNNSITFNSPSGGVLAAVINSFSIQDTSSLFTVFYEGGGAGAVVGLGDVNNSWLTVGTKVAVDETTTTFTLSSGAGGIGDDARIIGSNIGGNSLISIIAETINAPLTAYDDDTAAGIAGLVAGDLYQTTGSGAAPLNAAGIVMIKQ